MDKIIGALIAIDEIQTCRPFEFRMIYSPIHMPRGFTWAKPYTVVAYDNAGATVIDDNRQLQYLHFREFKIYKTPGELQASYRMVNHNDIAGFHEFCSDED